MKIRVVHNSKKNENDERLNERIQLKREAKLSNISEEMKMKIEHRIVQIEEEIGDDISKNYHKEIVDTLKKMGGDSQNLNGAGRKSLEIFKKKVSKIYKGCSSSKKG